MDIEKLFPGRQVDVLIARRFLGFDHSPSESFQPSRDWGGVGPVINQMQDTGRVFQLAWRDEQGVWECSWCIGADDWYVATHARPQMAVCKVALRWVEWMKPQKMQEPATGEKE